MAKDHFFVITGTSGTGKTTLIRALQKVGYRYVEEPQRKILQEQRETDGPALPSKDPEAFLAEVLRQQKADLLSLQSQSSPIFFDRGIPDLVAYARRFGVDPSPFQAAANQFRYSATVFVLPPWREIFVADEFRRMTFEEYQGFHEGLLEAYLELGYELKEVPRQPVEDRVDFVQRHLSFLGHSKEWYSS